MKVPNLDHLWATNPLLAEALTSIAASVDQIGEKLSINPQGKTLPPAPPSAISVTAANGFTHVTLTDRNPRTRQTHYFVEWADNPDFKEAQIEHLGVARQRRIPTQLGANVYVRAYAQLPDGPRSEIIYHGSPHSPTGVPDGSLTPGPPIPSSTGSGTAHSPGYGYGHEPFVSPPTNPGKSPKVYQQ